MDHMKGAFEIQALGPHPAGYRLCHVDFTKQGLRIYACLALKEGLGHAECRAARKVLVLVLV